MKFNQETVAIIGGIKLVTGTITSPVDHIIVPLSESFHFFHFEFQDVILGGVGQAGSFCITFSLDGGVTFVNDFTNLDSYLTDENYYEADPANIASPGALQVISSYADAYINFSSNYSSGLTIPANLFVGISAGSADKSLTVSGNSNSTNLVTTDNQGRVRSNSTFSGSLNPNAIIPTTLARATHMRIDSGYGTGQIGTGGVNWTSGSYGLWGKN